MNFGENIRNGLTNVAAGLTNLGHSLENMHKRHHDWQQESLNIGLVSDEDKLKMMKGDLYREARSSVIDSSKFQKLTDAIELLEEIKHAEFERKQVELKHRYSFPVQLEVFTNTCILLVIAVIIGSYTATFTCGKSNSSFCVNARATVYPINKFFSEPNANR